MPIPERPSPRERDHEATGAVDGPFDTDPIADDQGVHSDAACTIPWRADGHEAIQVFLDPALADRAADLCMTVAGWAAAIRDLDSLTTTVMDYARHEGLSPSIHEEPPDELSRGTVAIAFTLG